MEKETETADKDMMMDIIDFLKKMSLHEDDLIRESYLELLINKNENN